MPAAPQPPVPVSALSERSLRAHQQQLRQAEGRAGGQPPSAGPKRGPAQTDGRVSTSAPTYSLALDGAAAAASPSHLAAALRTVAAATAKGEKAAQGAQVGAGRPSCINAQTRPCLYAGSKRCSGNCPSHSAAPPRTATSAVRWGKVCDGRKSRGGCRELTVATLGETVLVRLDKSSAAGFCL